LGIEVLDIKNKCLIGKWLYKTLNEEGVWQELLQNKYLNNKTLSAVEVNPNDSPFWKGLMSVKNDFFQRGLFVIGDGRKTRFWEDTWLGTCPLADQFPSLYNVARNMNATVADVMGSVPLNISFRRLLSHEKWTAWVNLLQRLMEVQLSEEPDKFVWRLTENGKFSVKSFYVDLMNDHTVFLKKYIWRLKVPLKIRIFMWFLNKKVLLTKDNLAKRNWTGSMKCAFCSSDESIEHLFIKCPFAKLIWRVVHFTFSISPPANIKNLFGNWLNGLDKKTKARIRVGVCALLWAIWNCRNDIVFNRAEGMFFL
jgi:hypothetical protein